MAFCTNCGTSLQGDQKFCPNCGAPVQNPPAAPQPPRQEAAQAAVQEAPASYEAPAPASAPAQDLSQKAAELNNTPDTTANYSQSDISSNKLMAILSYIGILVLIPLLAAKDSPYARYHANQGLVLLVFLIIVLILGKIWGFLGWVGFIVWFVLAIIGIVNAAKGRAKELPIIGKFRLIK